MRKNRQVHTLRVQNRAVNIDKVNRHAMVEEPSRCPREAHRNTKAGTLRTHDLLGAWFVAIIHRRQHCAATRSLGPTTT